MILLDTHIDYHVAPSADLGQCMVKDMLSPTAARDFCG
jgi:hypothetical protein